MMIWDSNPGRAKRFITPSPRCPDPHNLILNRHRGSFTGQKRLGYEVDSSSPSSAEVKNEWRYTSTPIYAYMA